MKGPTEINPCLCDCVARPHAEGLLLNLKAGLYLGGRLAPRVLESLLIGRGWPQEYVASVSDRQLADHMWEKAKRTSTWLTPPLIISAPGTFKSKSETGNFAL